MGTISAHVVVILGCGGHLDGFSHSAPHSTGRTGSPRGAGASQVHHVAELRAREVRPAVDRCVPRCHCVRVPRRQGKGVPSPSDALFSALPPPSKCKRVQRGIDLQRPPSFASAAHGCQRSILSLLALVGGRDFVFSGNDQGPQVGSRSRWSINNSRRRRSSSAPRSWAQEVLSRNVLKRCQQRLGGGWRRLAERFTADTVGSK